MHVYFLFVLYIPTYIHTYLYGKCFCYLILCFILTLFAVVIFCCNLFYFFSACIFHFLFLINPIRSLYSYFWTSIVVKETAERLQYKRRRGHSKFSSSSIAHTSKQIKQACRITCFYNNCNKINTIIKGGQKGNNKHYWQPVSVKELLLK